MKLFVFGAGASLASQRPPRSEGASDRAPLVDDLFNQQYDQYRQK